MCTASLVLEVKDTLHIVAFVFALCSFTETKLLSTQLPSVSPIIYLFYHLSFYLEQATPSSSYLLILLFCPGSFHQLGVEHLLPAVLTLAICPPLWQRRIKHNTSLHHTTTSQLHLLLTAVNTSASHLRHLWLHCWGTRLIIDY